MAVRKKTFASAAACIAFSIRNNLPVLATAGTCPRANVFVGDYNHHFDAHAVLHALTRLNDWHVGVLVDEAHNLVERGRTMYSAELDEHALLAALQAAPQPVRSMLRRLESAWHALTDTLTNSPTGSYQAHDSVPAPFAAALREAIAAVGDWLVEQELPASDTRCCAFSSTPCGSWR